MIAMTHRVFPEIDNHLNIALKTTILLLRLNLAMLWEQQS
jgi:hypothetical protein